MGTGTFSSVKRVPSLLSLVPIVVPLKKSPSKKEGSIDHPKMSFKTFFDLYRVTDIGVVEVLEKD